MEQFDFPFPGRELADQELTYDMCYAKIQEEDRAVIVESAWQKGCRAAEKVFAEENGNMDFAEIVRESGLKLVEKDIDYVVGGQRYFSDYISGKKCINLYVRSVKKWAEQNKLTYKQAVNLILSHEYFHFLEVTKLGLTSREYQVPMVRFGKIVIGKTGIHALSEIGAHGFARTYYDLWYQREKGRSIDEGESEL